jgi:hypothetical protein
MLMRRLITAGMTAGDAAVEALAHKGEVNVEKILKHFEIR